MTQAMLPQELSDIVISLLFTDKTSSCTCALVCRSWLHPARCNLFHYVWLPFAVESEVTNFLNLLRESPGIGSYIREVDWILPKSPSTCPADSELTVSLLQCLAALSSDHGTTHKVAIDMRNPQAHYLLHVLGHTPSLVSHIKSIRWGCGDAIEWAASGAQSLASMLDSVESLTVAQWGIRRFNSAVPSQVLGGLFSTSITELVLQRLVFTDGSQFRHFVHAFTALERLSYQIMHWEDSTADTTKRGLPHAPPLRCITLGAAPQAVSAEVVRWLLDQPVVPPLKSIEASSFPPNEINELIHCCASSLVTLACNGK
jgi:hypothetical protein